MFLFEKPKFFGVFFESYTRYVFGPYSHTSILLVFGLCFALILYFVPQKHKPKAILTAGFLFAGMSAPLFYFLVFFILILLMYLLSNYAFPSRGWIFWTVEVFMLTHPILFNRLFGYYSTFYAFAAYYTAYRSIHYYVDVTQGSLEKCRFIDYISYMFYFPTISHGPIERIENLKIQGIEKQNVAFGVKRILTGISKYLVLVYFLNGIIETPFSFGNFFGWLVFTAYVNAVKFYLLFSGDIDIVIGLSALMGFKVSENFPKFPDLQTNLTKFWQNWQATIVNWLTAYVYFPLCRNRRHVYLKTMLIIMIIGWAHLLYTPEIVQFQNVGQFADFVLYYTLWGIFLGGTLAISKVLNKKKMENRETIIQSHPLLAKMLFSEGRVMNAVNTFITFNIIAIGWLSPLYILIKQF